MATLDDAAECSGVLLCSTDSVSAKTINRWGEDVENTNDVTEHSAPPEYYLDRMIALFAEYKEDFGCSDADFPDEKPQARQCEYEKKFNAIVCDYKGHTIGPDQCGKPEHDLCYRCNRLRVDIELSSSRLS
jgi:hypothetical protein